METPTPPNVAILGAGLSGLAAGCFLRMNGYDAHVFEHASGPGGVALTRWDPSHTIEGGVYFMIEHAPGLAAYEVYHALGLLPSDDVETLELYMCVVDEASGARLSVTRDLDRLERELHALGPDDTKLIDQLLAGARAFARFDPVRAGFEKPPELQGFLDKVAMGWHVRHVLSVFANKALIEHSITEWLASMKSPVARSLIRSISPYDSVPPWFVMMLLGLLSRGQLAKLRAGGDRFVGALEKRFLELGGRVSYNATVRKVLVDGDRAAGVELADGRTFDAHAVVSTVDTGQLVNDLLGGAFTDPSTRERLERWPRTPAPGFIHFATSGVWPQEPWLSQVRLREPFMVGETPTELVSVRFFEPGVAGVAPDETAVQFGFNAGWAFWNPSGNDGDVVRAARREDVARRATAQMEALYPGFSARVRRLEVVTPEVFARAIRAPRGVTSAWVPTPEVVNASAPRMLPGLRGLYLAGQWAVGGAGVLAVLYSGRHVAQLLCHHDERRFVGTPH